MKKTFILALMALVGAMCVAPGASAQSNRAVQVAGVAFYNFENLFDTIPNNPENRDEEFTPRGSRQWDGRKYWEKVHNLAYAISNFKTKTTPYGPAIIGVSEIENRSVMEDVAAQPELKDFNLKIVHHDSPDARGALRKRYDTSEFRQVRVAPAIELIWAMLRRKSSCETGAGFPV